MSRLRHDASLKLLLVFCSAYLLLGECSASAAITLSDGIQRADLRVTSSKFTQQVQSLGLSGEELILAKGAWGSLTFDLTHVESAYDAWFSWYAAIGSFVPTRSVLSSVRRYWWNRMDQNYSTLRFAGVDRYFTQLEALRPNDRREIQAWRRRHYRKILSIARSGITLEGVNTDLVALLEDLAQDYPDLQLAKIDLPVAAQDSLESYELRMHELIMQYSQDAIAYRKLNRKGFDETQDDGLRDRIETHSKKTIAPDLMAIEIRRLNRTTIDRLTKALPRNAADVFRKHALESVSPFAYTQPYYERLAGYAIESSLIETDVKDALRELIKARKRRRLKLSEKVEKSYEARYTERELLNAERVFFEINAGLRDYDEDESKADRNLKAAKRELGSYDFDGLAKVRQLLGRSFVAVRDARAAENTASEEAEAVAQAAKDQAAIDRSHPRHDSPFITHSELETLLESINIVESERKQTILSYFEEFAEKLRTARRAHERERSQLIPISEVASIEDPAERSHRSTPVVMQHMEHEQKWLKSRRVIEGVFTDQLAGELTDDQTDDWYREVRRLRRFRMIPALRGITTSFREMFDLIAFMDDLGIKYRTKADINAIVESYEIEMDGVLRNFEERHEVAQQKMMQLVILSNQTKDPADMRRAMNQKDKVDDLRNGPAKLNLRYVQFISEALMDVDRIVFRAAVRQELYPWANATPPVEVVTQAFDRDQIISEDRQSIIRDILSRYRLSRDAIIEDLIRQFKAWKNEADSDWKLQFQDKAEQRQLDRVLLEINTLREIRELFSPDQLVSFALDIQLLLSPTPQP